MTKVSGEDLIRRLATRAVHAGHIADPLAGAVMAPIYQTSTYVQQGLGKHKGYEYARTQNPTREALERNIAALEGGRHGFAFASGLAAVDAVLKLLSQGDHVVSGENVYGGTHRQMTHIWARHGLEFSFVDAADATNVAAAVTPRTRMVYAETPTNRSEEHTSELQSQSNLVCRLLLEKKKWRSEPAIDVERKKLLT